MSSRPYSALLELFCQVTPPLTQPPPSRRTRWPPRPCPTPSLAPYLYLLKGHVEATWQGALKGLGFSHMNWVLTAVPIFHESRRPLMDSRPHSKFSSCVFNRRMRSSGGKESTWTRWSDLAEVLYVQLRSWKYRSSYQSHQCPLAQRCSCSWSNTLYESWYSSTMTIYQYQLMCLPICWWGATREVFLLHS